MSEPQEFGGLCREARQNANGEYTRGVLADIKMASRAIREGWGVPKKSKARVVERMHEVLDRPEVIHPETGENLTDKMAVQASRVLVEADKVDQADYQYADKNERLDSGKLTERTAIDPVILRRPVSDVPQVEAGQTDSPSTP